MSEADRKHLIAVVGPTGSGKSELAIGIAELLDGEIVNCDSLQIYKNFNIGTAKIPLGERRGIPHHMIDAVEPTEIFTAGEYTRRARQLIADIAERRRIPIVAGGTGFYLRALLEGLSPLPARNEDLRVNLAARERKRPGFLHRALRRFDPEAAARIHGRDLPKTLRALEIRLITGKTQEFQPAAEPLTGFRVTKIGLFPPRADLYRKLDLRTEWMFANGLVDEVQNLLASGVPENAKPFESLGYRQALKLLQNETDLAGALRDAQQATRRYAKRQMTWFRHEAEVQPVAAFGADVDPRQWIESI